VDLQKLLSIQPKLLVAHDLDAPREKMPEVKERIKENIGSKKAFHIFHIHAYEEQGRSVFFHRLMRELIDARMEKEIKADLWYFQDEHRFSSRHVQTIRLSSAALLG